MGRGVEVTVFDVGSGLVHSLLAVLNVVVNMTSMVTMVAINGNNESCVINVVHSVNSDTVDVAIGTTGSSVSGSSCVASSSVGTVGSLSGIRCMSPVMVALNSLSISNGSGGTVNFVIKNGDSLECIVGNSYVCNECFGGGRIRTNEDIYVVSSADTVRLFNGGGIINRFISFGCGSMSIDFGVVKIASVVDSFNNSDRGVLRGVGSLANNTTIADTVVVIPSAMTARVVNNRTQCSAICVVTGSRGSLRDTNGTTMGHVGTERGGVSHSYCAMAGVTACVSLLSAIVGMFAVFVTTIDTVSLMINKVNIVGVVLISVARQAHRVNVQGTLKTGASAVLFRFLARSVVLYLVNKLVKLLLNISKTTLISGVVGIPLRIGFSAVTLTVKFSATVNMVFNICPTGQTTGVPPVRTLQES